MTAASASPSRYLVGIDLGTSNCALAFADTEAALRVEDFPIPQLRALGEMGNSPTLPSCLYLPAVGEFPEGTLALPWNTAAADITGWFARHHGARVNGRLVASAKSWLCHPGVDRTSAILPWGAPRDVAKVSPVEASARFLEHLAKAWDTARPEAPLGKQEVVLTVPASFDAVARALTAEAAQRAGLGGCTLVEEPQAAFQAFISEASQRGQLDAVLEGVCLVLVIDIGGGTTDFTLIRVTHSDHGPSFRRVAVGDHLMLGGDNMDAALAHFAEEQMKSGGRRLAASQWAQLVQACREAKEKLLDPNGPAEIRLALASQGSALLGGTLAATIQRSDLVRLLKDGFFPDCGLGELAARSTRTALQELGLPYAQDPAIPRQLASFLNAHRAAGHQAVSGEATSSSTEPGTPGSLPRPDAVLFNGGVFRSAALAERLLDIISAWWPGQPRIPVLPHDSLDLAVARGAAYHALARRGLTRRITGGSSHAIYVALQDSSAKPGPETNPEAARRPTALCVIPRGFEEGGTVDLSAREFRLTLGRPVQFPLFTSTADRSEAAGDLVTVEDELTPLPPLHALLQGRSQARGIVPVHLRATLTEIGTLELWCVANDSDERWRLEFELRGHGGNPTNSTLAVESMPARFDEARQAIARVFVARPKAGKPRNPAEESPAAAVRLAKQLTSDLERHLGPRDGWRLPALREMWGSLWAGAARRRRSADHERSFFQLAGFTLRPGFGYPLDDWRCEQAAAVFTEGIQFVQEPQVWNAWWVHWRRLAPGLSPDRHREMWSHLRPHLAYRIDPHHPRHAGRPKGAQPEGLPEMVRFAASLDHLHAQDKAELGGWITAQLCLPAGINGPWTWALGRLGARLPPSRSQHHAVPPEVATQWLDTLAEAHARGADGALFAITQVARKTGDRVLDLDETAALRALDCLRRANAPDTWQRLVTEVTSLDLADEARALGDTLPVGLSL